jgi:hypothetical protein
MFNITWWYVGPCLNVTVPGGSVQLPGPDRDYVVTNLLPGSRYNMTLVSSNNVGSSVERSVLITLTPSGELARV